MACNPNELIAEAICFSCLDDTQQQMVIIALLCAISQGGDGGSGNSMLSGSGSPVGSISATGPALYVQDDGSLWVLPQGGDSGDWIEVTAQQSMTTVMMEPPPEPDDSLRMEVNRLSEITDRHDGSIQSINAGVGQLHSSILAVSEKTDSELQKLGELQKVSVLEIADQTNRLKADQEARINALVEELNQAVKAHEFEAIKSQIESLKPAPAVIVPKKKSWWRMAAEKLNIF